MSRYEGLRELTEDDREDYRLQALEAREPDTHEDESHEEDESNEEN